MEMYFLFIFQTLFFSLVKYSIVLPLQASKNDLNETV